VTIAEFKSTGSNESSFGPDDFADIRRRKEESLRRAVARAQAAKKKSAALKNQQRGQGTAGV
jgi:hypothetical protein